MFFFGCRFDFRIGGASGSNFRLTPGWTSAPGVYFVRIGFTTGSSSFLKLYFVSFFHIMSPVAVVIIDSLAVSGMSRGRLSILRIIFGFMGVLWAINAIKKIW